MVRVIFTCADSPGFNSIAGGSKIADRAIPPSVSPAGTNTRLPPRMTTSKASSTNLNLVPVRFVMVRGCVLLAPGCAFTMITAGDSASEGAGACGCSGACVPSFLGISDARQSTPTNSRVAMITHLHCIKTPQLAVTVMLMVLLMPPAEAEKGTVRLKLWATVLLYAPV